MILIIHKINTFSNSKNHNLTTSDIAVISDLRP